MGAWRHRGEGQAHRSARAAMLRAFQNGQLCARCQHPMWHGDKMDADHSDTGHGYLGLSHSSPCRTCGQRCNQSAGGQRAAGLAGKQSRDRRCIVCGRPYIAGMTTTVTCGRQPCVNAVRAARRARKPDPTPPKAQGRAW